jgi:hypothetical protein
MIKEQRAHNLHLNSIAMENHYFTLEIVFPLGEVAFEAIRTNGNSRV